MIPLNTVLSSGTQVEDDLIDNFLEAIKGQWEYGPEAYQAYREELMEMKGQEKAARICATSGCSGCRQFLDELAQSKTTWIWETLVEWLQDYVPPFCYIGAHEGDGALYGVWVNRAGLEAAVEMGHVWKVRDLVEVVEMEKHLPFEGTYRFIWVTDDEVERLYLVTEDRTDVRFLWRVDRGPGDSTDVIACAEANRVLEQDLVYPTTDTVEGEVSIEG